jgi:hypothetical protein
MTLPDELQQSFEEQLTCYHEERQMPLLSRMELRAMQAGIEQGALQNARESVLEVLEIRFEVVPPELIEAINQIEDTSVLKQLHRQAIAYPNRNDSLHEVWLCIKSIARWYSSRNPDLTGIERDL